MLSRQTVIILGALLLPSLCFPAPKPSPELERALAAAAHARTLPGGEAYARTVSRQLLLLGLEGTDCMGHVPGWAGFPGFESVLIIGRNGNLKWIIRDAHDPMANCMLKKVLKATLPAPPADNWPVSYGIRLKR